MYIVGAGEELEKVISLNNTIFRWLIYHPILKYGYLVHTKTRKLVYVDGLIPRVVRLSSYHNVQTEETLNPELPTIPLSTILQSTDNFSEVSKLGEGGFGPVYKVLMIRILDIDFCFYHLSIYFY